MFRNTPSQRNTPLNREPERENLAKERNHNENGNKVFIKQVILYVKQDAVRAYIWAWSYYRYDTLNMPYCS